MSVRKLKTCLSFLSALFALGAMLCLGWALWWPCEANAQSNNASYAAAPATTSPTSRSAGVAPDQFEEVMHRPLRMPLYDPPPEKPKPVVRRPPPPPPIQVIGAVIEAGRSVAIMQYARGQVELKGVGQTVGPDHAGIEIEEVNPDQVVVRHRGERVSFPVLKN